MKRWELINGSTLAPQKPPEREVPHAVIETNYTCNRRCALCYNMYRGLVKPLGLIEAEIDQALALRNLETISLLGGEPTLHPDLPAIVRLVKAKNVYCQILTNGVVLFRDASDALLDRLTDAGVDRIVLHADCGQGIDAAEIDLMCSTLFRKFEKRGIFFALSSTIYRENFDAIPAMMRRYASFRHFDGILATLARPNEEMTRPVLPRFGRPDMPEVDASIRRGLSVLPSSYLPSSLDDDEIRWLIYMYYINAATGETISLSPAFVRLMRRIYRLVEGRNMFAATTRLSRFRLMSIATAVIESLMRPSRLGAFVRLARGSRRLRELRFHSIVLQSVPQFNALRGCVEICYHCPDATIRNGRLAPVCLADAMSPPAGISPSAAAGIPAAPGPSGESFAAPVYAHLEEA